MTFFDATIFDVMALLFWISAICFALAGLGALACIMCLLHEDGDPHDDCCACGAWVLEEDGEALYASGWLHERSRCWPEMS